MPATRARRHYNWITALPAWAAPAANSRSALGQRGALPADAARLAGPLVLRDGTQVFVRAIRPDDAGRQRAFHASLSTDTVVFRFFHYLPELSTEQAKGFTHLDYEKRMALVATAGPEADAPLLAVVRYDRGEQRTAEVAFVVQDQWQGRGIGTALLHRLAAYGRSRGITTFVAFIMGSNTRMLDLLRASGFPVSVRIAAGEVEARLDIAQPPRTRVAPVDR